METKKTRISFTVEELQVLKDALNTYSLEMMNKSKTWGDANFVGREDIWQIIATKTGRLWSRIYEAAKKLESK